CACGARMCSYAPAAYCTSPTRPERFGLSSTPLSSPAPPCLRRLKSPLRYLFLCPPPMCRDVNRPYLLRPPVFFLGSTRLFSGRHFVISSNAGSDLKRSVGVSGRNSLSAMSFSRSDQIDLLALL